MNQNLNHNEFCEKLKSNKIFWGVNNFWISIIYIFRFWTIGIYFLFFLLFTGSLFLLTFFSSFQILWVIIFAIPILFAILYGQQSFNLIDWVFWTLPIIFVAIIGKVLGSSLYKIGFIILACYIFSSVFKVILMKISEERIILTSEIYQKLKDKDLLFYFENFE